MVAVIKVQN